MGEQRSKLRASTQRCVMKKKKPKWLKILLWLSGILAILGVVTVAIFGYIFYDLINNPFNDRKFNATEWKEFHESHDYDNPRGTMAYHLRDKVLTKGMKRNEVKAILGEPDYSEGRNVLKYNLGMWSGFRIDYDSFDIYFDTTEKLTHIEIVQH